MRSSLHGVCSSLIVDLSPNSVSSTARSQPAKKSMSECDKNSSASAHSRRTSWRTFSLPMMSAARISASRSTACVTISVSVSGSCGSGTSRSCAAAATQQRSKRCASRLMRLLNRGAWVTGGCPIRQATPPQPNRPLFDTLVIGCWNHQDSTCPPWPPNMAQDREVLWNKMDVCRMRIFCSHHSSKSLVEKPMPHSRIWTIRRPMKRLCSMAHCSTTRLPANRIVISMRSSLIVADVVIWGQ